jgi:hypothetical protein
MERHDAIEPLRGNDDESSMVEPHEQSEKAKQQEGTESCDHVRDRCAQHVAIRAVRSQQRRIRHLFVHDYGFVTARDVVIR